MRRFIAALFTALALTTMFTPSARAESTIPPGVHPFDIKKLVVMDENNQFVMEIPVSNVTPQQEADGQWYIPVPKESAGWNSWSSQPIGGNNSAVLCHQTDNVDGTPAVCKNNERLIRVGMTIYAQDYAGYDYQYPIHFAQSVSQEQSAQMIGSRNGHQLTVSTCAGDKIYTGNRVTNRTMRFVVQGNFLWTNNPYYQP